MFKHERKIILLRHAKPQTRANMLAKTKGQFESENRVDVTLALVPKASLNA